MTEQVRCAPQEALLADWQLVTHVHLLTSQPEGTQFMAKAKRGS